MVNKLWGARFSKSTHPLAEKFTSSIEFDQRLAKFDVEASVAHAVMLGKCKIIPGKDAKKIVKGLKSISSEIKNNHFKIDSKAEDIHTLIQNKLEQKIGEAALKLHTARSRNDLVSLSTRMYAKENIKLTISLIGKAQDSLSQLAKRYHHLVIPGYTHLQQAQPILFKNYAFAYIEKLNRDKERLEDAYKRTDTLPLGSCALSGTTLPINRKIVAKMLDFSKIATSTLDAVSDRDFVIEITNALAILGVHLSRMAEDFIIYSSNEFNFIELPDEYCTGSSLMPHKKNPDCLELIRGSASKLIANSNQTLTLMKGLALSYNRDMQLDKPTLFDSFDITQQELTLLADLLKGVKLNIFEIEKHLDNEMLFATDLAEHLVKKQIAFKEAHNIIGRLIRYSIKNNRKIADMTDDELKNFSPKLKIKEIKPLLDAKKSVKAKELAENIKLQPKQAIRKSSRT